MPAVNETAVPTTASSKRHHPDAPPDIIAEEPERASGAPAAILTQLSASISEINQPISAVVMNAEAALQLLFVQPTDTEEQSGGCSLVSSRTECAPATSLTAPVR